MVQTCCRFILSATLLLALASSAAAATFLLPDDAIIEIRTFPFPSSSGSAPERNLPLEFHTRLERAMRKSGLTIAEAHDGAASPAPSSSPLPGPSDAPAPLRVTPLPPETPEQAERPAGTGDETPLAPPALPSLEGANKDNDTGNGEADQPDDDEPLAGDEAGRGIFSMPGEYAGTEIAPQTEPHRIPGITHILEGNVTLFQETVGNPTRVGGSIRIRTEAMVHCTYKIRDAATGKVIISDTSSGSSARVASQDQDIDAALAVLSNKAMDVTAARIAANLSGTQPPADTPATDPGYYQDSPGKRLKPRD